MNCPLCDGPGSRWGRDRRGNRRWYCRRCYITYSEPRPPRPFGNQYLTMERATMAIHQLMEGCSVRGVCRMLGMGQHTLLRLLLNVGEGCQRLHEREVVGIRCTSIQCDELWSFIHCKERTRVELGYEPEDCGDCYTWTALEPETKLLLAYAIGKRDNATGVEFVRRLRRAVSGEFQIDTDGLLIYRAVIPLEFGWSQDHAQVVKVYGTPPDGEARYSPPEIIDIRVTAGSGDPDLEAACTSHVERSNLTIRMMLRRFTRLTNAFSKTWRHHRAALALLFSFYNYCRPHMTLNRAVRQKCTPAMAAGLAGHVWSIEELIRRTFTVVAS
jgi:IS1 family transposase/transposase-like protein